ncbi:DUF711 family protein [Thermogladius sp. 4427co]|uniref:DUF711 family protein n=1 Tax=Thermogladius sp. 4427co TaxID=3450718 RepID=UPI003F79FB4B
MKPVIRAISYFTPSFQNTQEAENSLIKGLETLDAVEKEVAKYGYKVFTKRISMPLFNRERTLDVARVAENYISEGILVSLGFFELDSVDTKTLEDLLYNGFYISLKFTGSKDPVELSSRLSEFIHRVSYSEPQAATRLAVGFHNMPLETPYFPDSTSSGIEGVGLSFLYADYVRSIVEEGYSIVEAFYSFEEEIRRILQIVRGAYSGRVVADYSLSPWMEDSVVRFFKSIGYNILEPGFYHGISVVNKLIQRLADRVGNATGFNEVMLPYAEDSELIELGSKGLLSATRLLSYMSVCVAGPDMLVVPSSVEKLKSFILDWHAVSQLKNKPSALRIIPVDASPGEIVDLGRFGKIPVLPY